MNKEASFKKWPLVSWEPEILISGGLVLTLFNIQPKIVALAFVINPLDIGGSMIVLTLLSGMAGTLAVGFAIHLIVRGFWIMKMGIAYGLAPEFDSKKFNFKKPYEQRIQNMEINQSAEMVGKLSSLIFSITFFLLLISLGFTTLSIALFASLTPLGIPDFVIISLLVILLIDFASFGYLKKTKLGVILYPVLWIMYQLSLSFLYRDIYYYLINSYKRVKLIVGLAFYAITFVLLAAINSREVLGLPKLITVEGRFEDYIRSSYDDERDPFTRYNASISSYYQEKNLMRLYLHENTIVEAALDNNAIRISINDQEMDPLSIRDYSGSENQFGYLFFLDISNFKSGKEHLLNVLLDETFIRDSNMGLNDTIYAQIPFYKE